MTLSALHESLAASSAHWGEYSGTSTAADFGDARAEFRALLSSCGVYDLGWRGKIALTGSDRVRWLNGMVTNNVRDLATGRGVYAFLLNPQGRIQGDLYAYNRGESLMVDTELAQVPRLLEIFDHYIISDDVEVSDVSQALTSIGVAGPESRRVLQSAGIDVPQLEPLQFADIVWHGIGMTLVRSDNPLVDAYELWLSAENAKVFWEALLASGARPTGTRALEWLRVAAGIPRYGQDIRDRDLPQETEQARALHFSKGCYVGQEIVERIRSRGAVHRKFTGFEVEGALPSAETKIQADGKDIGEITTAASVPLGDGERNVALGYVRREFAKPEQALTAGDAKLKISDLPFRRVITTE
jgi:folate-binding protein YgfZ